VLALLGLTTMMLSTSGVNGQTSDTTTTDTTITTDSNSNSNCTTITDIVCNSDDNDDFSLKALCEAITISELEDDLNEDTWTLFAPNDDAFEALGRQNLDSYVFGNGNGNNNNTDNDNTLTELLLFHLVAGSTKALSANELPCVAGSNLITMANGEDSRTMCEKKDYTCLSKRTIQFRNKST